MDQRKARRVAANQARFRTMNEMVRMSVDAFDGTTATYSLMCECSVEDCTEQVEIDKDAYSFVRSDPLWFVVTPGHVVPDVEEVVEELDGHWIIRALGAGKRVAVETYNAPDGRA